jgi:hypothetical protein
MFALASVDIGTTYGFLFKTFLRGDGTVLPPKHVFVKAILYITSK